MIPSPGSYLAAVGDHGLEVALGLLARRPAALGRDRAWLGLGLGLGLGLEVGFGFGLGSRLGLGLALGLG